MDHASPRVVIGMEPHKRSVTIEVMTGDESILAKGVAKAMNAFNTKPKKAP